MSATKPVQEPPHASMWEFIRARCPEEKGRSCGFPWCNCPALKTPPLSTITNDGGGGVTSLRSVPRVLDTNGRRQ